MCSATAGRGQQSSDDGRLVSLQPGVIGAEANRRLAPFARKIGPDPASIGSAMIGGIAANNASGMCCGTAQNSYQTLQSMRIVLADGAVLDTGDAASRAAFVASNADLMEGLAALGRQARGDEALARRIRRKFAIKNTTGYSLNALIDFDEPFDILQHLMIGSEGTLGFISEITYRTVPDDRHKACALLFYDTLVGACEAVTRLKREPVAAVELMDRAALASVTGKPGMPDFLASLGRDATALLVEIQGADGAGFPRASKRSDGPCGRRRPRGQREFIDRSLSHRKILEDPKGAVSRSRRGAPGRHDGHHRGCRRSDRQARRGDR